MEISKTPIVGSPAKSEAPPKKTTLDKGVDWVKDKTQKGTLVGDNYIAVGAGTLVGGIAAVAGVAKLADNVPAVQKAVDFVFDQNGKLLAGTASLGAAYVLGEDAIQSFKEGSTMKGIAETAGATAAGLGGVELVGRQFNIPVAREAFSKTADVIGDNLAAIGGAAAAGGGVYAVKKGAEMIKDAKTTGGKIAGGAIAAGGGVAVLGGAELIGRQLGVKYMDQALTGPAKFLFNSKGGMATAGALIGATGAGAAVDGVRRLTHDKGLVNDGLGVIEVTAGLTAAAGGTSLVGKAIGNDKLLQALPESMAFVGSAAAIGTAVALGKHTLSSVKENGVTLMNSATGTGAALAALGGVQLASSKLGIGVVDKAFTKGWQPVLGVGLGAASFKFGSSAVREAKEGSMLNAAGQASLSFASAAGSAALLGHSLGIPVLDTFGSKSLEFLGDKVAAPVANFVVKNPFLTLGAVAVAGGAGAYAYYQNKEDKK